VFVPWFGDDCRLRWIDNATWRIFEHGLVECRTALTHSETHGWSGARVDIIREGFRKR
jgi:hypothetical protein